ncbi:MAG: competence/damage-inducible protein A [Bacteroidales bacterium]|nr:competence/damage-inducible protein A [Bacteroidales bacterium]
MNASILNIGDELLIGQVVNTNASWMAQQLTECGIRVREVLTIADERQAITEGLERCLKNADTLLITGGLGPTKDDITKHTLCAYFHAKLVEHAESLRNIERIFARRGYPMTETNRQQAMVPDCCEVIVNEVGTAPCMWFEKDGKTVVSLPGVPSEMKHLMQNQVLPRLKARNGGLCIVQKNLIFQGIGESFLSDAIAPWEEKLPSHISLAYLPQHGMLRLRLTASGSNEAALQKALADESRYLYEHVGKYLVGEDMDSLQAIAADCLVRHGKTLCTAESCTGGSLAARMTAMPGASRYYLGGMVAYSNEWKEKALHVSHDTLSRFGAVSEETVREMAVHAREVLGSDYAVATTGIAGPDGGTAEKPVGTVWIGVASANETLTRLLHCSDLRAQVIERTCNQVFSDLIQLIRKECGK